MSRGIVLSVTCPFRCHLLLLRGLRLSWLLLLDPSLLRLLEEDRLSLGVVFLLPFSFSGCLVAFLCGPDAWDPLGSLCDAASFSASSSVGSFATSLALGSLGLV